MLRKFLLAIALTGFIITLFIQTGEAATVLKFGHTDPPDSPRHKAALLFADKVKQYTGGKYELASEASRQASAAFVAAATAASTTSADAKATRACWSPVAGFITAPQRSTGPSQTLPPIQWRTCDTAAMALVSIVLIPTSVTR